MPLILKSYFSWILEKTKAFKFRAFGEASNYSNMLHMGIWLSLIVDKYFTVTCTSIQIRNAHKKLRQIQDERYLSFLASAHTSTENGIDETKINAL